MWLWRYNSNTIELGGGGGLLYLLFNHSPVDLQLHHFSSNRLIQWYWLYSDTDSDTDTVIAFEGEIKVILNQHGLVDD